MLAILRLCILTAAAFAALAAPALSQNIPPAPALYLVPEASTASGKVAVGPDGTVHMAAVSYGAGTDKTVTYAACAADCTAAESWTRTAIPVRGAILVEIAVTPRGAPRLLITAAAADGRGGRDFLYAECGTAASKGLPPECHTPGGWTVSRIAGNYESSMGDFFELLLPRRTFGLDQNGNPRFVFTDADHFAEPDHYGLFYMSCDGSCTDARNWTETNLANQRGYVTEQVTRPVLAIGPNGSAHLLAWVYAFEPDGTDLPDDLYYYECAAACATRANWRRVSLIHPGSGSYPSPTWDIAVDPAGRPRAAVFVGAGPALAGLDHTLVYAWCDEACTTDDGWAGTVIYDGGYGEGVALALDAGGRPRMAFLSPDDRPVIAACDIDCETAEDGVWDGFVFERPADMVADRPTAIPFTCDGEVWSALSPDLALGRDGRPYVAYDVSVQARCLYREFLDPQITFQFHEIWRGARLATPEN